MFFVKNIFYLLTLWATVSIIFAEDDAGQNGQESIPPGPPPNGPPQNGDGPPNGNRPPNGPPPNGNRQPNGPPSNGDGQLQDSNESSNDERASFFDQIPFFGQLASQFSSSFSNPFGSGSSGFGSGFGSDRQSEVAEDSQDDDGENEPQSRLFFSSLFNTRVVTCNYTSQAGTQCLSCRQVLNCFPSNVGALRTCTGFFPYCNNGRCSLFQGSLCNSSATNSTG